MPSERSISDRLLCGDNEGDNGVSDMKIVKKSKKAKSQKLSKSWKPAKLRKNLSKSRNLPNFDSKNSGPNFLTLEARAALNCLQLAFTEASILWHFDLDITFESKLMHRAMLLVVC